MSSQCDSERRGMMKREYKEVETLIDFCLVVGPELSELLGGQLVCD